MEKSNTNYFFFLGLFSLIITSLIVSKFQDYLPFDLMPEIMTVIILQIALFYLVSSKKYLKNINNDGEKRRLLKKYFFDFILGNAISLVIFFFYFLYRMFFTEWYIF